MSFFLPGITAGAGKPAVNQTAEGLQLQARITENLDRISAYLTLFKDYQRVLEARAKNVLEKASTTLLHRNVDQVQTDIDLLNSFQRQVTALNGTHQPNDFQLALRGQPSVEKPEDVLDRIENGLDTMRQKHSILGNNP